MANVVDPLLSADDWALLADRDATMIAAAP
jgi:hypothetical protein